MTVTHRADPLIDHRGQPGGSRAPAGGKPHWATVYSVLLGISGPLAIALTPDSEHVFWSAIVLLAAAALCVNSPVKALRYRAAIAILPLPIAEVIAHSSATLSLLMLIAVAVVSYGALRSSAQALARQAGPVAPQREPRAAQDERNAMQLFAAASHDLRQPVQALVAQVDLMGSDATSISPRQFMELQTSVNTLAEMFNDLLDVNRVHMRLYEASLQPVDVRLLLQEVEQVFTVKANAKGLRLLVECPAGVWVKSDLNLLRRIVFNLMANAIRYTDAGGIRLSCVIAAGRAILHTEDTGRGMKVGELAAQGAGFERRPTTSSEGLGLGLGIVSTMALQLGHKLRLSSELGEGTHIEVDLGECIAAAPAAQQPHSVVPTGGAEVMVAIIEDDAAILRVLVSALATWGCRTVSAGNSHALMAELCRTGAAPGLVIADLNLGSAETGLDLVHALRKMYGDPAIPAIILTGDALAALKNDAFAGIHVLYKPVRPSELRKLVGELVFTSKAKGVSA
jgi:signal transduction histidine kinase/CheY-like chemotaxis protein